MIENSEVVGEIHIFKALAVRGLLTSDRYYISIVCQKYHPSEQISGEVPTNIFYFNIEMPAVNLYGERFSWWHTILFAQLG